MIAEHRDFLYIRLLSESLPASSITARHALGYERGTEEPALQREVIAYMLASLAVPSVPSVQS